MLGALCAAVVAILLWRWKVLLIFSFDPEGAAVAGYPVNILRYGLLLTLAVMVAVAMKIVGILLVGAFLVIPSAAAVCWSSRAVRVVWISAALAAAGAILGMIFCLLTNAPAGASIVLALVVLFGISRIAGTYRK
jgi:zinc transport system permease protein